MNFFTGFLVGVVSLIPGISGGTILVLMKKYDVIAYAISHFKERKYLLLLVNFVIGVILGAITFARIVEFLFYFFPNATLILFSGLVFFHLPHLIKSEKIKPNLFWFGLGIFFIFSLSFLNSNRVPVIMDFPKITLLFLIFFACSGAIDGFFTILPGVSGSMVMMILGPYYLYKSFLASLNIEHLYFFIPLSFYFIGDILGFYLGSKFSVYFLNNHRKNFMSCVYGMVLASVIVLFPIPNFSFMSIMSTLFLLLISYIIVFFLNKS